MNLHAIKGNGPRLAVVTYNKFVYENGDLIYPNGIHKISGVNVLISAETFASKLPHLVTPDDLNFKKLIIHKGTLERILVFLGKPESGSLRIPEVMCKAFDFRTIKFISCHHGWEEKMKVLEECHTLPSQWMYAEDCHVRFTDKEARCNEIPWMLGYMHYYIGMLRNT
jgi:hypothetical protein